MVAEFQAFVRDLHGLAAEKLVDLSKPELQFRALLVTAATESRFVDRGNDDLPSIQRDFRRLGIDGINGRIGTRRPSWMDQPPRRGDRAFYGDLIDLRNALARGNQRQLDTLRGRGVADTVTWARARLAGLNRTARTLDHIVWDHLAGLFGTEPW